MNCPQLLKISMLLDGELSPTDEARLRTHFEQCQECSQAWEDFKALSLEVRSVSTEGVSDNVQEALERILNPAQPAFWRRSISVPAPLAAAAALLLVGLSIWAGMMQPERPSPASATTGIEAPFPSPGSGVDLARFDRGERPLIYKQPKPEGRLK